MRRLLATTLLASSTLATAQDPIINYSVNADAQGITNTVCAAQQYTSQKIKPCLRVRGEHGSLDTTMTLQARTYAGFNVSSTFRDSDNGLRGQHILSRKTPVGVFRTRLVNEGGDVRLQNSELEHTINNWRMNAQVLYYDNEPRGARVSLARDTLGMNFFDTPQAHGGQVTYRLDKNDWSMNLRVQARQGRTTNNELDYSIHAGFNFRF